MALHSPKGFLGSGNLLVRSKVNGVWGNYVDVKVVDKFEIKADAEKKDNMDKGIGTYGSVESTAVIPKPSSISASIKSLSPAMVAALSFGTVSEVNITGSTGTMIHSSLLAGDAMPLDYMQASALTVEATTSGGTALTLNTDYEVNPVGGYISFLTNQTNGVQVEYTYPDMTGFRVDGMTRTTFILGFLFIGKALNDDRFCKIVVSEATMMPKSALDFMGNDYIKFDLEGTMVGNPPFTITYFDELGA